MALTLAANHQDRVRRLVLVGSVGIEFPLAPGLNAVWVYQPSIEQMRRVLGIFAHDTKLVNDDLATLRYEAASRSGIAEASAAMFPAPRQRDLRPRIGRDRHRAAPEPALVLHGRED